MSKAGPGPTSRIYFSQRLRLHYVDWGNADAPPLVLVHGGRDHCRNWDWVAEELRRDWHIIAPDLRGHGDSEWSKDGTYMMAGYIYDLAQLIHQLKRRRRSPSSPIRSAATSPCATPASIPENVAKLIAIEGLGPSPADAGASACAKPFPERMRAWIDEQRGLSGRLPRRYASIEDACKRMQEENKHLSPEQARHLTQHGVNQNEDGTYSWKFDNYVRSWPPYDMPAGRRGGAVGAHHLPDAAGLRQGELGLQPGRGRPRAAFQECGDRHHRGRRPLGAPRPARRVPRPDAEVPQKSPSPRPSRGRAG